MGGDKRAKCNPLQDSRLERSTRPAQIGRRRAQHTHLVPSFVDSTVHVVPPPDIVVTPGEKKKKKKQNKNYLAEVETRSARLASHALPHFSPACLADCARILRDQFNVLAASRIGSPTLVKGG